MATANPTTQKRLEFAARLGEALDFHRITDPRQRVKTVAEGAGVTPRTARKYLSGESMPIRALSFLRLCERLKVFHGWLWKGQGVTGVDEAALLFFVRSLPKREQSQFYKFTVLISENNEYACELADGRQRREITLSELLDCAEAEYSRRLSLN